jgi:DNA helicase-2/ATP-dependent DNA helicase PcrA
MNFLKRLNPVQHEAVTYGDGPLLILAGAGSGKTSVLTSRIAYLIEHMGVDPSAIFAVTFTNKAAGEMSERLDSLLGGRARSLWLGTFHSLGLRILRTEAAAGIAITVYGDDDQIALIKESMAALNIPDKAFNPRAVLNRINSAKNENIGPEEFVGYAKDFMSERVAKIYTEYQRRLRKMGVLDFGDLICGPLKLFTEQPQILEKYQNRFRYILVDEYQDTNRAQYLLTNMLAKGSKNLFAVGDPDQSIYAWRGACIKNILDFQTDYPGATVLKLEQNYRSTQSILAAANSIIEKNTGRMEKALWTENPKGSPAHYEEALNEYEEARLMIRLLKRLRDHSDTAYRDSAVFYRTNAQSRVFEESLIREGIPYVILGGTRFYDRKEIKDAIAYLRVVLNPNDSISFKRVINTPPRKIGKVTLGKIIDLGEERGVSLIEATKIACAEGRLNKTKAASFTEAIDSFVTDAATERLSELTLRLIEDSGYMMMLQDEGTDEAAERVDNLFELVSAIKDYERANPDAALSDFLDHVALISDVDSFVTDAERLTLMTLHSAKGLEFKNVFMAGMEEGLFPHSRSADSPDELEEERRLCYVGMTRAKERLHLLSARQRSVYGETSYRLRSRFIDEIAPDFIEHHNEEKHVYASRIDRGNGVYVDRSEYAAENSFANSSDTYTAPSDKGDAAGTGSDVYYTSDESQLDPTGGGATLAWRTGMRVTHPAFGPGVIRAREGSGDETKLTVSFRNGVTKKLIVKYANLMLA